MKQESRSSSSSSSSPSSPTVGEMSVREREDAPNSDISPVPVSEVVDDRTGETQANQIPKTNKKETTIERGNPCDDSEIPEWLQEFRENLVDDEIPLQGGSHASSSHEVSLEPTTKRREDLGKHSVKTHFTKDRNCEICQRTKITFSRAEGAMVEPTRYLVIIANLETITDMRSWCRIYPLNGSKHFRAKQKLHRKLKEACKSSWSPIGSPKSFTLTIPWNSAKLVKISPGIIARLHHTDRRLMVLLKEHYAE